MKFDQAECLNWCFGDLLSNAIRGKVAEFIVAKSLGIAEGIQDEWGAFDLSYKNAGIEIKSSAYLQSWHQQKPSNISFDIAPRKYTWDASSNAWTKFETPRRVADIYVFCVFKEQNREIADPLNTEQWEFYILHKSTINETWGIQKELSLRPLNKIIKPVLFEDIHNAIDAMV